MIKGPLTVEDGTEGYSETSVAKYQYTLREIPLQRRSHWRKSEFNCNCNNETQKINPSQKQK